MESQLDKPYVVLSRSYDCRFWSWTEHIQGLQKCFIQEKFITANEWREEEIISQFQSSTPHSSEVLLHHLEVEKRSAGNPLLLVHGASHDANLSWGESLDKKKGLIHALKTCDRPIYAVTFAHPHGDNLLQAVQLNNVIKRIQELTGGSKIDLIAHSKGGISAWAYLAGLGKTWDADHEGQVEKYIMLGTPNRGLDYPFRHVIPNWWVKLLNFNAPLSVDEMLWYGQYIDTTEHSLYKEGGAFPGLSQLLFRWDEHYPIQSAAQTLYYGGRNWLIHSRGIETAMAESGNFMNKLLQSPIDREIELHILAGNHSHIRGLCTEWDGPSDGLVFVDSVLYTDGLTEDDKQIKRKTVLPLNHLDLLYDRIAHEWVMEGLVQ
ncbi:esterase/lipase family protein [Ammoniphilus sp. 3BR4]|uniref:esterase/lipase family protein n=1 Tax=Ammoniphilus sp. 3BR4 TaxID=3158265 RepID=UPI0034668257